MKQPLMKQYPSETLTLPHKAIVRAHVCICLCVRARAQSQSASQKQTPPIHDYSQNLTASVILQSLRFRYIFHTVQN